MDNLKCFKTLFTRGLTELGVRIKWSSIRCDFPGAAMWQRLNRNIGWKGWLEHHPQSDLDLLPAGWDGVSWF